MKLFTLLFFFSSVTFASLFKSEKELIAIYTKAIVKIIIFQGETSETATGFFIDREGTLVTNYHAIVPLLDNKTARIQISDSEGVIYNEISIGKCGENKIDLCLLKVKLTKDKPHFPLKTLDIGNGNLAYLIGNGLCHETFQVLKGLITSKRSTYESFKEKMSFENFEKNNPLTELILTDVPFCPGDSGSPLFDAQGTLLGINTARIKNEDASKRTFIAITVNEILKFTEHKIMFLPIDENKIKKFEIKVRKTRNLLENL